MKIVFVRLGSSVKLLQLLRCDVFHKFSKVWLIIKKSVKQINNKACLQPNNMGSKFTS